MGSHSSIEIISPADWGAEWGGTKRVWLLAPTYPGPVLVRQLDGR